MARRQSEGLHNDANIAQLKGRLNWRGGRYINIQGRERREKWSFKYQVERPLFATEIA
jgi:hypothetical protein